MSRALGAAQRDNVLISGAINVLGGIPMSKDASCCRRVNTWLMFVMPGIAVDSTAAARASS